MNIPMILTRKFEDSQWTLDGDDYVGLTWLSESPKPSEDDLLSLWPEVQYEVAYERVEKVRQSAYQATADPLFFKWQAGSGTKEEWEAERQRIKDEHPYPEAV